MPTPTTVQARFQVRADTAANWTSANPTLLLNEIGIETDTKKLKMGDGTTAWASLAYFPSIVSGGTVLGNLEIGTTGTLTFEGSTANGFETTLAVVDPTADRTITLPNVTGTVITTGDSGTITSGMIADGAIVNADVNASAAIAGTKISPDFGSQNIVTTGSATAASLIPTTSTAPNYGIYSPSTSTVGVAVNGALQLGIYGTSAVFQTNAGGTALYVDTANNRTGIGTPNPDALLTVSGIASFGAGAVGTPSITTVGDLDTGIWFPAANTVAISTGTVSGGIERFRVTSTGNVAVSQYGTASAKLHIRGDNSDTIADLLRIEQLNAAGTDSARLIISADAANNLVNYVSTGTNAGVHVFFSSSAERFRIGATGTATISAAASNAPFIANIGASEVARIDSSGRLLVGTSTAESIGGNDAAILQISGSAGIASIRRFIATSSGPILRFGKSRAATLDNTIVQSGDVLGQLSFCGADGASVNSIGAAITAEVDGTPGAADMPGRLVFSTTADGASTPTERLRIDSSGRVGIGTSSPSDILTVKQTVNGDNQITIYNDDTTAGSAAQTNSISFDFARTGSSAVQRSAAVILAGKEQEWDSTSASQDGYLAFYTTVNINSTEKLRITSAGNVGIGTTSPGELLSLSQDVITEANLLSLTGTSFADGEKIFATFKRGATNLARIGTEVGGAGTTGQLIFETAISSTSTERARIDSSGRLLVGTSTALANVYVAASAITPQIQLEGNSGSTSSLSITRQTGAAANLVLQRGVTGTPVAANHTVGQINFNGFDGTNFLNTAQITSEVDGTPGTNDMPGRLILSTTLDGASNPTERFRITNDGVRGYNQAAPVAIDATATLTVADLKTGIITSTTAAAVTGTLPTGTLTEGGFNNLYTNFTFEWTVINTGATNNFTVAAGTAHTVVGNMVVAAGNSGRFATRRTAANTFVTYRLSS